MLRPALGPGGRRPPRGGVHWAAALNLVGGLLKYFSAAFLVPVIVALVYGESVVPFVVAAALTGGAGWALERLTRGREQVGAREGFLVVALTWLLAAVSASIPYLLSGTSELARPMDALFEAMSGLTTTGASILTDIPALDRSMLMWRQFTQWLGGMGIVVLAIAVLPRLRVGGRQLFASEAPGHEFQTFLGSMRQTARTLWVIYVGLTALEVLVLAVLGWTGVDPLLNPYEAVAHAFTTMPTGGFSTQPRSIEAFAPATQWVITLFIILAGTNFVLLYRALRKRENPGRDEELRLYLGLLTLASLSIFAALVADDVLPAASAIRGAVFQAVSIMTSTGYASADFNQWPSLAVVLLLALMFVGGSALSTAGGIKVVRHLLFGKIVARELDQTIHPEIIRHVRFNDRSVPERTLRGASFFVLIYIGLFGLGTLLLAIQARATGIPVTPLEAISASAATLGNIGPGLGFLGPMGSYQPFSDSSKATMFTLMWIGRLEIIPILALLTRRHWRT